MHSTSELTDTQSATAEATSEEPRPGVRRVRLAMAAVAMAVLAGFTLMPSASASAWVSPTGFTTATCDPNSMTIRQHTDFYRTGNETVVWRAITEKGGSYGYGSWYFATPGVSSFTWTAARGEYRVWVQYGIWNPSTRAYTYYNHQVAGTSLSTLGRQDGYFYIGGLQGRCVI
ncbi:MAG: hypothetical protein WKF43_12970 [Acidimicrobiales bacterium]